MRVVFIAESPARLVSDSGADLANIRQICVLPNGALPEMDLLPQ